MELTHILAFNLALFAAMISPGPALLVAMRASVAGGRATGMAVGAGLATMASLWTLAALLGLETIFLIAPWTYTTLKIAGALYLIWIAVKTWRAAKQPLAQETDTRARSYASGVLVNLGNPKSVLFAAAVLVVIFPPDMSLLASLTIAANHLVVELIFYSTIAIVLSTPAIRDRYLRLKPLLDRASALILGALGLRLLMDR